MTGEIQKAVRLLAEPGQVIELRAIGDRTASGYFDNPEELARNAEVLDTAGYHGIYLTLNPVHPALLSRRANRVKTSLNKTDVATSDHDILSRRWLPIDLDPVRPSGISSSDEEHRHAKTRAEEIAGFLSGLGWPQPIIADSGNGAHLLYRIDLPNDEAAKNLIKSCLETLDVRFSDEVCQVDCANHNAGRIWKLYGTRSRKGDSTSDRPHRRSKVLTIPDEVKSVPSILLSHLADLYPREPDPEAARERDEPAIRLSEWLNKHHLSYHAKPYLDGRIFLLETCPFSSAHTDGAYAIQFASGAIFAGCHHDSCGGGRQRWADLRKKFEGGKDIGDRLKQLKRLNRPDQDPETVPVPAGDKTATDPALVHQATRILTGDSPLRYMLETFSRDHEGDRAVAECLIMSLASRSVINSKGLHVSITGESGKGKSHTIDTLMRQIPPAYRLDGRMSDKALFYITGMQPGTVISLDDHALSDQMQEILKGVTTSFQKPFIYRTVSKDRTGQICTIPERCVWWVAKVEGAGDDQVFNRMLTCWIDDSEDQDQRVLERTLEEAGQEPATVFTERPEILTCQQIWDQIQPVWVIIPYALRIRFLSAANRRNPDMLLDLIRSHAALMQYRRQSREVDGIRTVYATEEDFYEASRLYTALNGECGGQMTKLTRREAELITAIQSLGSLEVTVTDLQRATGLSNSVINKLLNGCISHGQSYSGLLEKCPAIGYLDRSVSSGSDAHTTSRRSRVYTWDPELYGSWVAGGAVWLEPEESGVSEPDEPDNPPDASGQALGEYVVQHGPARKAAEQDTRQGADTPSSIPDKQPEIVKGLPIPPKNHPGGDDGLSSAGDHAPKSHSKPGSSRSSRPNPHDFIAIEGWPRKEPCSICGRPYSQYQERMTRDRMTDPPHPNQMLCTACFEAAKVRVALEIQTIPGLIDPNTLEHRPASSGICRVCRTGSAVWYDPSDHQGICETCYQREAGFPLPDLTDTKGGT